MFDFNDFQKQHISEILKNYEQNRNKAKQLDAERKSIIGNNDFPDLEEIDTRRGINNREGQIISDYILNFTKSISEKNKETVSDMKYVGYSNEDICSSIQNKFLNRLQVLKFKKWKLFAPDTVLDFGQYGGKKLKEVFEIDPLYIKWCILCIPNFYVPRKFIFDLLNLDDNNIAITAISIEKMIKEKPLSFLFFKEISGVLSTLESKKEIMGNIHIDADDLLANYERSVYSTIYKMIMDKEQAEYDAISDNSQYYRDQANKSLSFDNNDVWKWNID